MARPGVSGPEPLERVAGFSLVEALIAVFLIAVAATGVAQVLTLAAAANLAATSRTMSTILASQKVEQLRSLNWGYERLDGGVEGEEGAWQPLSDLSSDLAHEPAAGGGSGLSPSPSAALEESVPGYVDYLGADGAWLGTGSRPVSGTVYVRRWSVGRVSMAPDDMVVLQVRVIPLRREHALGGSTRPGSLPDDVWLITVLTRRAA